jgi:hypothetical protein
MLLRLPPFPAAAKDTADGQAEVVVHAALVVFVVQG